MTSSLTRPKNLKTIEVERLGTELCAELYTMRSDGYTYEEILNFLSSSGHTHITKYHLRTFFQRYNIIKSSAMSESDIVKNQLKRRQDMDRRIDLVSNILEDEIVELSKDDSIKPALKATKIAELCRVMLETVNQDAKSSQSKNKTSSTNVQVNIGDQLKQVAAKKQNLRKEILYADYDENEKTNN